MLDRIGELCTPWLTVVGERLEAEPGRPVDYWRIERADSVVVLPIRGGRILAPPPAYRPGVGRVTLDLPGGRLIEGTRPEATAVAVLVRELDLSGEGAVASVRLLEPAGWDVDSSTSNQRLFGAVAEIEAGAGAGDGDGCSNPLEWPADATGVAALLSELSCLQCRAVVQAWWSEASTA